MRHSWRKKKTKYRTKNQARPINSCPIRHFGLKMPSAERQDSRTHAEETEPVPSVLQDKNDLVSFGNVDFTNDLRPNRSGTFSERSPQTLNERVFHLVPSGAEPGPCGEEPSDNQRNDKRKPDSTEDKELETPGGAQNHRAERKAAAGDLRQNEGCLSRGASGCPRERCRPWTTPALTEGRTRGDTSPAKATACSP